MRFFFTKQTYDGLILSANSLPEYFFSLTYFELFVILECNQTASVLYLSLFGLNILFFLFLSLLCILRFAKGPVLIQEQEVVHIHEQNSKIFGPL